MYRERLRRADLGDGTYVNPILCQDIPDPTILRDEDTYYLCGSTGEYFPALAIYTSKDLVNWRFLCHPFPNYTGNVWAPDLAKYNGRYYLYFAADGTNFASCSDRMDGGWCDPVDLKVGFIDPGHCVFEGKRYLFLSGNHVVPLSEDGMSVTGAPRQSCVPAPIPDSWDVEGPFPESPKLLRRGEWTYLIYADGGTSGPATAHMMVCARARNPITGPWTFSPYNPMVHTWSRDERWHDKGHGCLVEDTEGRWWTAYHAYERGYLNQGRRLLLEPVAFTEDGWPIIVGGQNADAPRRKPCGEAIPCADALSDDFTGPLGPLWQMRGSADYDRIRCGGGLLRLRARDATDPGKSHPLVVTPGDHRYEVETTLERPAKGCLAGVILIYDPNRFAALEWDGEEVTLYRLGRVLARLGQGGDRLRIRLRNDRHSAVFFVAEGQEPWRKLNYVQNVESMNTTAYDGFTSLRAGVFARGSGEARFGAFVYRALPDA